MSRLEHRLGRDDKEDDSLFVPGPLSLSQARPAARSSPAFKAIPYRSFVHGRYAPYDRSPGGISPGGISPGGSGLGELSPGEPVNKEDWPGSWHSQTPESTY
ncbi:hypothetical protein XANCAGTX0491_004711 [Xanthoria calcicola]